MKYTTPKYKLLEINCMDIMGCFFKNMFNIRQIATTPSVKRTVDRPFGIDISYPEMLGDGGGATGGSRTSRGYQWEVGSGWEPDSPDDRDSSPCCIKCPSVHTSAKQDRKCSDSFWFINAVLKPFLWGPVWWCLFRQDIVPSSVHKGILYLQHLQ